MQPIPNSVQREIGTNSMNGKLAQLIVAKQNPDILALLQALLAGEDPRMGTGLLLGPKDANVSPEAMNYHESRLQDELQGRGAGLDLMMTPNIRRLKR